MMILVEKLRKFGDDVLVKVERSCEFVLCTLFCYETIPDFDLIDLPYYPWIIEYQIV